MGDIFQNVGSSETAYEATFEDLAQRRRPAALHELMRASCSPVRMFYVTDPTRLQGADWSVQEVLTRLVLSLLGAAAFYRATHLKIPASARVDDSTARLKEDSLKAGGCCLTLGKT